MQDYRISHFPFKLNLSGFLLASRSLCLVLCACFLLLSASTKGQKTIVSGRITEASTGESVPFVTVFFKGTKTGANSDIDGYYRIESYYSSDSLSVMATGFATQSKLVKEGREQVINFALKTASIELNTVVIRPDDGPNPAIALMKKVLRNKKINNREKLDAYEYEAYNKVEFDLNNITDEFQEKKIFKPFAFVFEGIDTTEEKVYLPVFMTESLSDFYFKRDPKTSKEIIKASQVSGIENESVQQFLGDMYQNMNVYDNNIVAFDKSFVSPVSAYCLAFYDYDILDSAWIGNKWCFQVQFFPRRKQELLFFGEMWINDTTYAVKQIDATIADDANINWIKKFQVRQEFEEVEPEVWMIVKDHLLVDFNMSDKKMGVYGRKTSTYKNFTINKPHDHGFYSGISDIIVNEDAGQKTAAFWEESRHIPLTEKEQRVYSMVDSLKVVPQFKTVSTIINLFVTGYKVVGLWEFGPYYTFYSYNPIEGNRFRIGGRTSNAFSKKIMFDAYTAYGLRDERWKYGTGFLLMLNKNPRMAIGGSVKSDLEQLGQSEGAFREDNVLSSFLRRNPANKLTDVNELKGYFEREWLYGLSNKLIFSNRVLKPAGNTYAYVRNSSDGIPLSPVADITLSEVTLYTRFAYKEKFVYGEFERVSLGTIYPEIEFAYTLGTPGVLKSDYRYQKLVGNISDTWRFGPLGYLDITVEAGKFIGKLPYPALMLHQGNETFFYDESSYNTMNFFEFVNDRWASVWGTYHFDGLFLNRIPLMRKLKWREVVSAKALIGGYSKANDEALSRDFDGDGINDIYSLNKPFVEGAIGIENIFKIFRVDMLYRFSYLDHPDIVKIGMRVKLQVSF